MLLPAALDNPTPSDILELMGQIHLGEGV